VTGTPVKLSATPGGTGLAAPRLGEHTGRALGELLGMSRAEVDELAQRRLVYEGE
jgi:crotonobetainyl-CoA:carnitine CoA-transferase CaiB-like acyl-CoA transferase